MRSQERIVQTGACGIVSAIALVGSAVCLGMGAEPGAAQESIPLTPGPLRPASVCPSTLDLLMVGLLRDLPSYANRVASRSLGLAEESGFGTMLVAGSANFEGVDLSETPASTLPPEDAESASEPLRQVFFTTLERRYQGDAISNMQGFHWMFLAPDEAGWRLALMYSSFGGYPEGTSSPTPPFESSNGIVGQAVRLWLRDCRAGAIYPVEEEPGVIETIDE